MSRHPVCTLVVLYVVFSAAVLAGPPPAQGPVTWQAVMGAESQDEGRQAMAFLPNELWIHAGDSVTWTSGAHEGHTLTFLKQTATGASTAGTSRPAFPPGCTAGNQGGASPTTPDGSLVNGSACVNSGPFADGADYTVTFPQSGNFKFVCLIHRDMTGVVHVLNAVQDLPYDQSFYDAKARSEARDLINGASQLPGAQGGAATNQVTADPGKLIATGGGKSYLAIMRFLPEKIHVHVGDTVEWTNVSPSEPHTITFAGSQPEPPAGMPINVAAGPDGALQGTLLSPNGQLNTGLIGAALQDQAVQTALGVTRLRVTFTSPGTYEYFCALHDELGMKGEVVVGP